MPSVRLKEDFCWAVVWKENSGSCGKKKEIFELGFRLFVHIRCRHFLGGGNQYLIGSLGDK